MKKERVATASNQDVTRSGAQVRVQQD